jgi:ribosomal-protein-alanine N-acetyltransferase
MGGGARQAAYRVTAVSPITIRAAGVADLDAIHAIEVASFSDPWSRSGIRDMILGGNATIVVAASGGRVLGFAVLLVAADEAEIANVAVAFGERRRGVGAMLIDHLLEVATARGARTTHLEVRESNAAARALYAARKFREVARRRQYYRLPDEDAVVMRRES